MPRAPTASVRRRAALRVGASLVLLPLALARAGPARAAPPSSVGAYRATVRDLQYIARTYYFIADHPLQWDRSSLQVYLDDRNPTNDIEATPGVTTIDPAMPIDTVANPSYRGYFLWLSPGTDYDLVTPFEAPAPGLEIPVIRLHQPLGAQSVLGVYFEETVAGSTVTHGDLQFGDLDSTRGKLIGQILLAMVKPDLAAAFQSTPDGRYDSASPWYPTLAYELRDVYDLGVRDIPPGRFHLAVRHMVAYQLEDPDTLAGSTYLELLGLDRHGEPGSADPSKPDGRVDAELLDAQAGLLRFPDLHPFDPDTTASGPCPPGRGGFLCLDDVARNPLRGDPDCFLNCANPKPYYYMFPDPSTDARYYLDITIDPPPVRAVELSPGRPNPFHPTTRIPFQVRDGASVIVRVFDIQGRPVRTLFRGVVSAGEYETSWDARDDAGRSVASGVYVVRITGGGSSDSRSIVLLR
jgi:hypothetical protein